MSRIHNVFHVSQLQRYIPNPSHILETGPLLIEWYFNDELKYDEVPIWIVNTKDQILRRKQIHILRSNDPIIPKDEPLGNWRRNYVSNIFIFSNTKSTQVSSSKLSIMREGVKPTNFQNQHFKISKFVLYWCHGIQNLCIYIKMCIFKIKEYNISLSSFHPSATENQISRFDLS